MGIPSYFAHVVKRHRAIMKKRSCFRRPIDNFYMDCNSLIYDAVRDVGDRAAGTDPSVFATRLIASVCARIRAKAACANPTTSLYIAFDGVAPVAKLAQQRSRRYKSWFQRRVAQIASGEHASGWDTAAITPGTAFMAQLSDKVRAEFSGGSDNHGGLQIIVSPPDEPGEGEHKIYQHIRDHPSEHANACTVIYGLDADLIMLTLNHLSISPDTHLYREAPEFARSLCASLDPNEAYLLDIPAFAGALAQDMSPSKPLSTEAAIADYTFLCFMLGNDFMPHFPALNIRTSGIDRLMQGYTHTVAARGGRLVEGTRVQWKMLRRLVNWLAAEEHSFILQEYAVRAKQARRARGPQRTVDDELNALPLRDRSRETYIAPHEDGWQARYYRSLLGFEPSEDRVRDVCVNYLEGLEWTWKYYVSGCCDWRWTYRYDYPPLLADLSRYVPALPTEMLSTEAPAPVPSLVQLSYVLPAPSLHLLPQSLRETLLLENPEWYEPTAELQTAFCKYLWEAHPQLEPIDLASLERTVSRHTLKQPPAPLGYA